MGQSSPIQCGKNRVRGGFFTPKHRCARIEARDAGNLSFGLSESWTGDEDGATFTACRPLGVEPSYRRWCQ